MQVWVDGTTNNGLSVRCDDSGHEVKFFEFYSREYGTASYRPQLIVTYQSPVQSVAITYTSSASAEVDVEIRNITGRSIRRVTIGELQPAGVNTASVLLTNKLCKPRSKCT